MAARLTSGRRQHVSTADAFRWRARRNREDMQWTACHDATVAATESLGLVRAPSWRALSWCSPLRSDAWSRAH